MKEYLFKKIKNLSGGSKRKASLCTALIGAPPLLIVDEPTRSLDPVVSQEVMLAIHFMVHKLNSTFIFTSKKIN